MGLRRGDDVEDIDRSRRQHRFDPVEQGHAVRNARIAVRVGDAGQFSPSGGAPGGVVKLGEKACADTGDAEWVVLHVISDMAKQRR